MAWSILTPDICAHWDGHHVSFLPGISKAEAPSQDRLEETWLRYYASIFNPARLKVKAMQNEMPKKYWRNLPEASLIKPLDRERSPQNQRDDRPCGDTAAQIAKAPGDFHDRKPCNPRRRHRSLAHRRSRRMPRLPALGKTRLKPCSVKAPPMPRSCCWASNPATRKTSPVNRSWDRPDKCSIAR